MPWPNQLTDRKSGQINAYFQWKTLRETPQSIEMNLSLVKYWELQSVVNIPTESTADISLRRLHSLKIEPGATVRWTYGSASGQARADAGGCVTIPRLKTASETTTRKVMK